MSDHELVALALAIHGLSWLLLLLVRMDKAGRERRYQQRLENARSKIEQYRLSKRP